jgi:Zn-dependent protease with chaperone function
MKYTSKLPDESVNNPKENLLLSALKLMASLAVIVTVVYIAMLLIVDYTVENLSPESEKKLMEYARVDFDMNKTKESHYLQNVTDKLARCAKLPYDVKTYILEEDSVNAFALPGGKIMVTRGMLNRLKSENELASVIGHELGHFKHRDHLKGLGKSLVLGVISMLVADNYGTAFTATLQVTDAKYSQSQELDADLFGLDMLACSYGNVKDAETLFARMDKGERWKYFLASHPDFHQRVEKMREYAKKKGYPAEGVRIPLKKF